MTFNMLSLKSTAILAAALLSAGTLGVITPAQAAVNCVNADKDTDTCTVLTINTFGDVIEPAMVSQYRALHPEIKLSIKKTDMDPLSSNFFTTCAAKGAGSSDIIAIEVSLSGYWRSYPKCFVDLRTLRTTVGNKSANDIKKDYLPWRWEQGVGYNDSVIGIPTDVGGLEVAYRWDLFKAKGLPYKRDEVSKAWNTWPKFIEFGKKYMAKVSPADKKKNVAFMDNAATIYAAIMNQGTEKYYKNNGTDQGELIYKTNPRVKLAFNTTVDASKAGIGSRVGQFSSDWNVGMNRGTFAAMLSPAWMMDYIKGQAPKTKGKWDIADIPGGGGNQGGSQLGIPFVNTDKKSDEEKAKLERHQQLAWDFIAWYLAPEQQLKVFKIYGLFPSAQVLYNDPKLVGFKDKFFNNAPTGAIYADGVKKLKPIFEGKLQRCIDMAMGSALSLVINGKEKVPAKAFSKGISDADKCNK
jgi:cellobiose transport system substrate-binding protein